MACTDFVTWWTFYQTCDQQIQTNGFLVITSKRIRLKSNNLHNLQVLLSYLAEYNEMMFFIFSCRCCTKPSNNKLFSKL